MRIGVGIGGFEGRAERPHGIQQGGVGGIFETGLFQRLRRLGPAHISGVLAGQGEFGQTQRIGAQGRGLAGGNQFVRGGDGVGNDGGHLEQQVFGQGTHARPVGDIGAELEFGFRFGLVVAIVHAAGVELRVKVIGQIRLEAGFRPVKIGGRRELAAVGRRGGNGAGIHEGHGAGLPVAGLGAFAVGEVARGMADGKRAVRGRVTRAEAGTAEGILDDGTGCHEFCRSAVADKGEGLRFAGRVDGKGERAVAGALPVENGGGQHAVFKGAARTAGDDALIRPDAAVMNLGAQLQAFGGLAELLAGLFLHRAQQIVGVADEFRNGPGIAGMEGQGNHGLHGGKVDADQAIVAGGGLELQLRIVVGAAVQGQIIANLGIRAPDGGKTGCFRGHDVNAAAVFHGQSVDAGAGKFHDPVLDEAVLEDSADDGQRHVLRPHAGLRGVFQPDEHDFRGAHVIGLAEELLDQLGAAFTHGHGAQRAIAGVAVGTENHLAAAGKHFAGILMDDGHVRRYEDAAVFLRGGEAEKVVVFVDGAAHGAEAVMAVGEGVGHGKAFKTAGPGRLDDAHIGDVMGGQSIEAQAQGAVLLRGRVVRRKNAMRKRVVAGLFGIDAARGGFINGKQRVAVNDNGLVVKLDHGTVLCGKRLRKRCGGTSEEPARVKEKQQRSAQQKHTARAQMQTALEDGAGKGAADSAKQPRQG